MGRYENFREEDFIKDQFFIKWVLEPEDEKINLFWAEFVKRNPQLREEIDNARRFIQLMNFKDKPVSDREVSLLKDRIDGSISYPVLLPYNPENDETSKKVSITKYMVAAALSIIVVSVGLFQLLGDQDITKLAVEDISRNVEHVSAKGKRSMIILEDGTKVWLNADSKITYSENFGKLSTREVFLDGEAFFDVAKDADRPFKVHAYPLTIKVTGTSFNVKSYQKDEFVETTLEEGRVIIEVNDLGNKKTAPPIETTLLPNQQARYNKKSKKIELQNRINAEEYSNWRSGGLYFEERSISEVISMLERWYNVEIQLEHDASPDCLFSAKLDNMTLEEVLELFRMSDAIEYTVDGEEVRIYGKLCEN